jgi:hypothetical protein
MFNYEQSAMSSRAAVVALHSLADGNSPASTPDGIRTHVCILWHAGRLTPSSNLAVLIEFCVLRAAAADAQRCLQ